MTTLKILLFIFAFCFFAQPANAMYSGKIDEKIWALQSPAGTPRWLIIHANVKDRHGDLYHVEVLQLKDGKKPFEFERLAAHMAITENALRWSIVHSQPEGSVYPETFDNAYKKWNGTINPPVCKTNVNKCLGEK